MPLVYLLELPAISGEMPFILTLDRAFPFVNAYLISAQTEDN
jgi:hypothetical protein